MCVILSFFCSPLSLPLPQARGLRHPRVRDEVPAPVQPVQAHQGGARARGRRQEGRGAAGQARPGDDRARVGDGNPGEFRRIQALPSFYLYLDRQLLINDTAYTDIATQNIEQIIKSPQIFAEFFFGEFWVPRTNLV